MNCSAHAEKAAVRDCTACGKPFCEDCLSRSLDRTQCEACVVGAAAGAKKGIPVWAIVLMAVGGAGCLIIVPIILFAAIAIPNMVGSRMTGNETAAIGGLRTIASVQWQFRETDAEGDGNPDFATSLSELVAAGLIDPALGTGTRSGYVFSLSGSTFEWNCSATPVSPRTGTLNFAVCTDGVVRFSGQGAADCMSAAIQ
ncbi:MAG: hypothetical protein O7H41_08550 [Planctomycetota bacterium]|nr:hypothetical protein [Planctomycetota bacterium]